MKHITKITDVIKGNKYWLYQSAFEIIQVECVEVHIEDLISDEEDFSYCNLQKINSKKQFLLEEGALDYNKNLYFTISDLVEAKF